MNKLSISIEIRIIVLLGFSLLLIFLCDKMPIDIEYIIGFLSFGGVVIGMLLPPIFTTWLLIFLLIIGSFLVIIGHVIIPIYERAIVVMTMPIFLFLASWIKFKINQTVNIKVSEKQINDYFKNYNLITNLSNKRKSEIYYSKLLNYINNNFNLKISLFHWEHFDEYHQLDATSSNDVLKNIAFILQKNIIPSEKIFYLNNGYYLVIAVNIDIHLLDKINYKIINELQNNINFQSDKGINQIQMKLSVISINKENYQKFTYDNLIKKLIRKQETYIIREYQ